MKKIAFLLLLITNCITKSTFSQQIEKADSLGLPGDNLNLYAVLDLFQKSKTFEEFEKQLNLEDSKVNNLDLNNDGKTDYIKVIDHQTGESHAIVLQIPVSETETQDVAVIEIEKDKTGKVVVQIVGNEELYGKDYIVEPTENDPTVKSSTPTAKSSTPNKKSDTTVAANGKTVIINNYYNTTTNAVPENTPETYVVANQWPIVRYVYAPAYVVYVSPWFWYSYPPWWSPWSPWYWHNYYWHHYEHYHYHYGYYHRTPYYRAPVANGYYGPRRSVSTIVQNNRAANVYQRTYNSQSRTGDGRVKSETPNPTFNNRQENKASTPDNRQKPDNGINKPSNKPRENQPSARPGNKPSNIGNRPAHRGNRPAQNRGGGGKSGNRGGGRGR